jgi:phospholipid transport system substrate-binding protein
VRRLLPIIVGGLSTAALALATAAASPTPLEYTRQTLEQTRTIVDSTATHNEKLAQLSKLLQTFLDTDTMGKAALDKNWSKFTPAQQKEFLTLFRELFQRTYVQKLLLFERPDFAYVGEHVDGGHAQVDTKILTPRDEFAVVYEMRADGNHWLATDIKIEDLSLTVNFRRQLDRLLAKSSANDVLDRMRRKYGPGGKGGEDEEL